MCVSTNFRKITTATLNRFPIYSTEERREHVTCSRISIFFFFLSLYNTQTMEQTNYNILVEAKNEYTKHIIQNIRHHLLDGIISIYAEAKQQCDKRQEPKLVIVTFQHYLSQVPKWNETLIGEETASVVNESGCVFFNDLITAVFVCHTKILSFVRVHNHEKKINLQIPTAEAFIHEVYIELAREFWKQPFLLFDQIPKSKYQKNLYVCQMIIEKSIETTIRKLLPVKSILQKYLNEDQNVSVQESGTDDIRVDDEEENTLSAATSSSSRTTSREASNSSSSSSRARAVKGDDKGSDEEDSVDDEAEEEDEVQREKERRRKERRNRRKQQEMREQRRMESAPEKDSDEEEEGSAVQNESSPPSSLAHEDSRRHRRHHHRRRSMVGGGEEPSDRYGGVETNTAFDEEVGKKPVKTPEVEKSLLPPPSVVPLSIMDISSVDSLPMVSSAPPSPSLKTNIEQPSSSLSIPAIHRNAASMEEINLGDFTFPSVTIPSLDSSSTKSSGSDEIQDQAKLRKDVEREINELLKNPATDSTTAQAEMKNVTIPSSTTASVSNDTTTSMNGGSSNAAMYSFF